MIRWIDDGDGDEIAIANKYTLRAYLDHDDTCYWFEMLYENERVIVGQAETLEHAKRRAEDALEEHQVYELPQ